MNAKQSFARFVQWLLVFLMVGTSLSAFSAEDENDPKFGFELETRDPLGEITQCAFPYVTAPILLVALTADAIAGGGLGASMTVGWTISIPFTLLGFFYEPLKMPMIRRYQKMIFKLRKYPYHYVDNFVFNEQSRFYLEPLSDMWVRETKNKPATVDELKENSEFINDVVFNKINTLCAGPAWLFGSGHMHIDRDSAFKGNSQLMRDFIVDMINTPGLYLGPYVRDRYTSNDPRRIANIRSVIEKFDADAKKGTVWPLDMLTKYLISAGLTRGSGIFKESAITLKTKIETIELRFLPAHRNAEEMILWAQLFKSRINYLKAHPGVELKPYKIFRGPVETYKEIQDYVTETGLDWEPYRKMLPFWWRWFIGPLAEHRKCNVELENDSLIPAE